MIHYYTNRELAQRFAINLARWKRWSRSFLPPDPLGGMQSGYARQYLFKDLFKVFLGGYLLSHFKLSVHESRKVLGHLSPWLKNNGFFDWDSSGREKKEAGALLADVWVYFCPLSSPARDAESDFRFLIRSVLDVQPGGSACGHRTVETYEDEFISEEEFSALDVLRHPDMHGFNLSALHARVVTKLQ